MSNAASLLRQTRLGAGLSQIRLADLSGVTQSAISRAEHGGQDLTVGILERLVHAVGWRLAVLPSQAGTVADAAVLCARFVAGGDEEGAYRSCIQLADWLGSEDGAERVALTVAPPASTGDRRFDALIAGVTELRLNEGRLPHPRWLATGARLEHVWWVDESSVGSDAVAAATPAELRDRGVFLAAVELSSV